MLSRTGFVRFGIFPNPSDGELIYSVLARLRYLLGNLPSRTLLDAAFGSTDRRWRIGVLVTERLQDLVQRIPGGAYSVDRLIREHTIYPYVSRFQTAAAAHNAYEDLLTGGRFAVQRVAKGFRRLRATPHVLAFCPECVRRSVQATGQAAWRRIHQLPLVFRCAEHDKILRTVGTPAGSSRELICCPNDPDAGIELWSPLNAHDSLRIAEISAALVGGDHGIHLPTTDALASRYQVDDVTPATMRYINRRLEMDLEKRFGHRALWAITGKFPGFARVVPAWPRSFERAPVGSMLLALLLEP